MWCIPAEANAAFVCQMEAVLEVYRRAPGRSHPVVCMDETTVQCVKEVCAPIPAQPRHSERYDVQYERNGVAHLLAFYAPFDNWRRVDVADNHAAQQWAQGIRRLIQEDYPEAQRITLVMDNLNTHTGASLYKAFPPALARSLLDKLEFVYTPKHGSWLNMAECEFSVLARQCLDRRLPDIATITCEIDAWTNARNQSTKPVDWRFTTEDARIKLKRLYPKLSD
jgi:transposase